MTFLLSEISKTCYKKRPSKVCVEGGGMESGIWFFALTWKTLSFARLTSNLDQLRICLVHSWRQSDGEMRILSSAKTGESRLIEWKKWTAKRSRFAAIKQSFPATIWTFVFPQPDDKIQLFCVSVMVSFRIQVVIGITDLERIVPWNDIHIYSDVVLTEFLP